LRGIRSARRGAAAGAAFPRSRAGRGLGTAPPGARPRVLWGADASRAIPGVLSYPASYRRQLRISRQSRNSHLRQWLASLRANGRARVFRPSEKNFIPRGRGFPCRLRRSRAKFTRNLRKRELRAVISRLPEGCTSVRIKMPPMSGGVCDPDNDRRPTPAGRMRLRLV